jgi:hypothetical protein
MTRTSSSHLRRKFFSAVFVVLAFAGCSGEQDAEPTHQEEARQLAEQLQSSDVPLSVYAGPNVGPFGGYVYCRASSETRSINRASCCDEMAFGVEAIDAGLDLLGGVTIFVEPEKCID